MANLPEVTQVYYSVYFSAVFSSRIIEIDAYDVNGDDTCYYYVDQFTEHATLMSDYGLR